MTVLQERPRSNVAGQPPAASEVTIDVLTDDLLSNVLARLMPRPGMIATRAALAARRAHLTHYRDGECFALQAAGEVRATTRAWRDYLARAELPEHVVNVPLWCRSRDAEELYADLARGLPSLGVCKRWHMVLSSHFNVALCGVRDTPPVSTEVLVLAWDWTREPRDSLDYLSALPRLRALLVWNTIQLKHTATDPYEGLLPPAGIPPLPPNLPELHHLVFFVPPEKVAYHDDEGGDALLASITEHPQLRTLVLPVGLYMGMQAEDVAMHLTELETLVADGPDQVSVSDIEWSETLRLLHARPCEGDVLFLDDADDGYQEPLADLEGLESLKLTQSEAVCCEFGPKPDTLDELADLPGLTRLELSSFFVRPMTCEMIADATALRELILSPCPAANLCCVPQEGSPLEDLQSLTLLHFGFAEQRMSLDADSVAAVGRMTGLQDLMLSAPGGVSVGGAIRQLTCLTRLWLRFASVSKLDCEAIACVSGLEALQFESCAFMDGEAVFALRPLASLCEFALGMCTGVRAAALRKLKLTRAFKQLRLLEVADPMKPLLSLEASSFCSPKLRQLQCLEDLILIQCVVGDEVLREASKLPELRRVVVMNCTGCSLAGIRSLQACPKLLFVDIRGTMLQLGEDPRGVQFPFTVLLDDEDYDYAPEELFRALHMHDSSIPTFEVMMP